MLVEELDTDQLRVFIKLMLLYDLEKNTASIKLHKVPIPKIVINAVMSNIPYTY